MNDQTDAKKNVTGSPDVMAPVLRAPRGIHLAFLQNRQRAAAKSWDGVSLFPSQRVSSTVLMVVFLFYFHFSQHCYYLNGVLILLFDKPNKKIAIIFQAIFQ